MPLLKNGERVEDSWTTVTNASEAEGKTSVIFDLETWNEISEQYAESNVEVGLLLTEAQSPAAFEIDYNRFSVIALRFPAFTDGRAYSYARLLRDQFGYTGELRAVGDIGVDQYAFMQRCGFDCFDVSDSVETEVWQKISRIVGITYQSAQDGASVVSERRQKIYAVK